MLAVPKLNWPLDLYSDYTGLRASSTAPLLGKRQLGDNLCYCGCKRPHHMAVSGLDGDHGHRRVLWFATLGCKNKHLGVGR